MPYECRVNMTRSENEDSYELLKRWFCETWNACSPDVQLDMVLNDRLKKSVRDVVNSQRQLDKISSIEELLDTLEQRLALSAERPQLLHCIALYCISSKAKDDGSAKIKDWALEAINKTKKFMTDRGISPQDLPAPFILGYKNVRYINGRSDVEPVPQTTINEDSSIDNCLHYLRLKFGIIGNHWPSFVRKLPSVKEGRIQNIRSRMPGENVEAFVECLKYWKSNSPLEERNRKTLIRAANACKLPDIADGLLAC